MYLPRSLHPAGCILFSCCVSASIVACSSDSDDDINYDVPFFDVYYISVETESGVAYLQASRHDEPPDAMAEVFEPDYTNHERSAWLFNGQDNVTIRSMARLIGTDLNLVVPADDGLMQVSMVEDDQLSGDFANWTLTPLGNGHCYISNAGLGIELVLSVTGSTIQLDGSEWHTIEMASIDDSLLQEWTVTRVGDPPGNYEQMCSGST